MPALKNLRHEAFAQEYVTDHNGGRAYERAGYTARGHAADQAASRLLRNVKVRARIDELEAEAADRAAFKADDVIRELGHVAFASMGNYVRVTSDGDPFVDLSGLTPEQWAAVAEVSTEDFTDGRGEDARDVRRVRIKLHPKVKALEDLGRYFKLFVERLDLTSGGADLRALVQEREAAGTDPAAFAAALLDRLRSDA